jgi:alpha-ketoglutarate-dependent taurine dioxygenase
MTPDPNWFKTINCADIEDVAAMGALIAEAMGEAKVLHLTGSPIRDNPLDFWLSAGSRLGPHFETRFGAWQDVQFNPDVFEFRHSKTGQPLHTDGAYVSDSPDYGLFYCARQAQAGGATRFIDAATVAELAGASDPTLLDELRSIPVRFGKPAETNEDPGTHRPVLLEIDGRLTIAWNSYQVAPGQGEIVERLKTRFRTFLDGIEDSGAVSAVRWAANEAAIFKDDEVLHGRAAFEAERAGDRVIWKTYFRRGGAGSPAGHSRSDAVQPAARA